MSSTFEHKANLCRCLKQIKKGEFSCWFKNRKQNLQANSRFDCQFWHKREKEAQEVVRETAHTGTLFLPQGVEIEFFSLYGQPFPKYRPILKLIYFGMKLGHWESRSCTYTLFLPKGIKRDSLYGSCTYTFYLPSKGSKLSLFSLYRQQFPRYWPIFNIALFGHETWPLAKVP